jgi:SnoaL-like protein
MWLPEFQDVIDRAGARLDEASLELRVDDPQYGTIDGEAAFDPYSRSSEEWLRARDADVRTIATTVGERRTVGEFEVALTQEARRIALPVAVVVEPDGEAERFWVRIYHSQWPLLGRHVIRLPLLAKDPTVRESDVVGEYQAALAAGDVGRILATFEPDGCFREPAGGEFRVCGTAALLELFTRFFGAGGGITLEHCTATEDGVRTALEFNAVKWGSVDMTHQAGVAVYERGRTGKLAEARIYDDVEGPVE